MPEPIPPEPESKEAAPVEPQRAVWFFVAATFVFAVPALVLPDAEWWVRVAFLSVGLGLVVGGGYYLSREMGGGRSRPRPPRD